MAGLINHHHCRLQNGYCSYYLGHGFLMPCVGYCREARKARLAFCMDRGKAALAGVFSISHIRDNEATKMWIVLGLEGILPKDRLPEMERLIEFNDVAYAIKKVAL
jgi:hypothetical protein